MAFDTLTYAKKLQESGVPSRQAEAHAEALKELVEGNLATKQDLREMEARLEVRLAGMEVRLAGMEARIAGIEGRLSEMETRLLIRLGAIVIGSTTILGAFMGILIALLRV